jgi:PleD family two-component response regulator
MTGLANRRALHARLGGEWLRARRYDSPLSLLLVDVDGLMQINDEHGHATGDEVLRNGYPCRCGDDAGHGFRCALGWRRVRHRGAEHAEQIGTAAGAAPPAHVSEQARTQHASVTISVGVATFEPRHDPAATIEGLLDAADSAMYQAKHDGRNCVSVA